MEFLNSKFIDSYCDYYDEDDQEFREWENRNYSDDNEENPENQKPTQIKDFSLGEGKFDDE